MRELCWMAEGKLKSDWDRTSDILALIANCNRDSKKHPHPYRPEEFNPFAMQEQRRREKAGNVDLKEMKGLFTRFAGKKK